MLKFFDNYSSIECPVLAVNIFINFGSQSVGELLLFEDLTHECLRIY